VEARILEVTLRLLADQGYSGMTLDDIAARAGASKPTLYRRWSSKADLATAALRTLQLSEPAVNTGSTTGDLTRVLQNFRRSLLRPNGIALVGTVLAEESNSPELLALFRERIVGPRRRMLFTILERAEARRELRPDADIDAAVNLMVGAFYARYLAHSRIPTSYPAHLVSIVWEGIRHAPTKGKS
jgi:AcrR family transcriptional regulator